MDHRERALAYKDFLESLSRETVSRLDRLAAPDLHFHDPFTDARGLKQVKKVFNRFFDDVDSPRYTVTHCLCEGDICFLRWHFTCRPKVMGRGLPWVVDGITEIRFDGKGRVVEHIEHWDAGEQVYERMPVVRTLLRLIKQRIRTPV